MFLFQPIHFLKFGGKSQPQRSYKNGSYKRKRVYPSLSIVPSQHLFLHIVRSFVRSSLRRQEEICILICILYLDLFKCMQ